MRWLLLDAVGRPGDNNNNIVLNSVLVLFNVFFWFLITLFTVISAAVKKSIKFYTLLS